MSSGHSTFFVELDKLELIQKRKMLPYANNFVQVDSSFLRFVHLYINLNVSMLIRQFFVTNCSHAFEAPVLLWVDTVLNE